MNSTPPPHATTPSVTAVAAGTRVLVWDLPVRIFHWAIVLLLVGLVATGLIGNEWLLWHMRMGLAVIALIAFRILWGFVGSRNARFGAFLAGPSRVLRYARSFRGTHEVHATHNPAGGWMVVLLLLALLVQVTTGLFTNDDILWGGPLSERVSKDTSDALSAVHRRWWWVIVAFSVLHIGAVLAYLAMLRDNLIAPMFTGYKVLPPGAAGQDDGAASLPKALVLMALCAFAVWYAFVRV